MLKSYVISVIRVGLVILSSNRMMEAEFWHHHVHAARLALGLVTHGGLTGPETESAAEAWKLADAMSRHRDAYPSMWGILTLAKWVISPDSPVRLGRGF
jgi:hypothetical protein